MEKFQDDTVKLEMIKTILDGDILTIISICVR